MTEITLSLDNLAEQINAEHTQAIEAVKRGLQHAVRCGELLIDAKAQVNHGAWLPWVSSNCQFSERTARAYMRVARHWPELSKTAETADLTIDGALKMLEAPKEPPGFYEVMEMADSAFAECRVKLQELDRRGDEAETLEKFVALANEAGELQNALAELNIRLQRRAGQYLNAADSLEIHEYGQLFPMMTDKELDNLADSIKQAGLHEPITLFEGKILDGKCRYEACKRASVTPEFRYFPDDFLHYRGSALGYVVSANLHRQSFTKDQRGVMAVKLSGTLEALNEIRDRKLYRETHETFEGYCADRWGLDTELIDVMQEVTL